MRTRNFVDRLDRSRGANECVAPRCHRRGTGMRVAAGQRYVKPAHALRPFDHTDLETFALQDRSLFDVQLEKGRELARAAALGSAIADLLQRFPESFAGP